MIADFDIAVRLIVVLFENGYFWQLVGALILLLAIWRLPEIIRALKSEKGG